MPPPAPFAPTTLVTALIAASFLAYRARRKRSLSLSGTLAGFVVGFLLVATGMRGLILFYFYQIGTMATKYNQSIKEKLDGTAVSGAERSASQVLCVSGISVVLSLLHAAYCGSERAIDFTTTDATLLFSSNLTAGVVAHHATSLADTLASELGILNTRPPFLVSQPWRTVPPGTNGGVSVLGFIWSAVGGLVIGVCYIATDYGTGISPLQAVPMLIYATLMGLIGSLVDSIVGAILQASYLDEETKKVYHQRQDKDGNHRKLICGQDILSNEQVNLLSVGFTTWLGGWVLAPLVFGR